MAGKSEAGLARVTWTSELPTALKPTADAGPLPCRYAFAPTTSSIRGQLTRMLRVEHAQPARDHVLGRQGAAVREAEPGPEMEDDLLAAVRRLPAGREGGLNVLLGVHGRQRFEQLRYHLRAAGVRLRRGIQRRRRSPENGGRGPRRGRGRGMPPGHRDHRDRHRRGGQEHQLASPAGSWGRRDQGARVHLSDRHRVGRGRHARQYRRRASSILKASQQVPQFEAFPSGSADEAFRLVAHPLDAV